MIVLLDDSNASGRLKKAGNVQDHGGGQEESQYSMVVVDEGMVVANLESNRNVDMGQF